MSFQENEHRIWSRGILITKDLYGLADLLEIYRYLGGTGGGGEVPDPPPAPIATVDIDLDNDGDPDVRVTIDDIPETDD